MTARPHDLCSQPETVGAARSLEDIVCAAAACNLLHDRHNIVARFAGCQIGAERGRDTPAAAGAVNGDDRPGSGEPRALQRIQAHRAATDHRDGGAGFDRHEPHGGPHTCHHAAADQAGSIERNFLGHPNRA